MSSQLLAEEGSWQGTQCKIIDTEVTLQKSLHKHQGQKHILSSDLSSSCHAQHFFHHIMETCQPAGLWRIYKER